MTKSKSQSFGDLIRETRLRQKPPISLRKFAQMVDMAAAYLSKVESNQDRPPSAEKVEKMAEILRLNKNELCQLAKRTPTIFEKAFRYDSRAAEYLRVAMNSGFSPEELELMIIECHAKAGTSKPELGIFA